MLTRAQLKELFARHDLAPLKRLGANYLTDPSVKDRIISAIAPRAGDTILEIGPGLGALTVDLAGSGATLIAVDKDRKALSALRSLLGGAAERVRLVHGDILEFDIAGVSGSGAIKVAGNLPYYITTPIIERLMENAASIVSATILVQKEFAERLLAPPGSKTYGSFSCFVAYHARGRYIATVKRGAFYPEPDVDSAIVHLEMRKTPPVAVPDPRLLFRIIRGAFNQRRKTIINSLTREEVLDMPKDELAAILDRAGINPASRPETLSLEHFALIANLLPIGT